MAANSNMLALCNPLQQFINKLKNVQRANKGWTADCPNCQRDKTTWSTGALAITGGWVADEFTITDVKCANGCSLEDILKAAGLPIHMGRSLGQAAIGYAQRGFSVIPLKPRTKEPLTPWKDAQDHPVSPDQVKAQWEEWPEANIGIVTGRVSGLVVLDIDGEKGFESLAEHGFEVPRTPTVGTARGRHFYFAYPVGAQKVPSKAVLPGVDIKADGGYVVAPPSIHPDGEPYRFEEGHGLGEVELAPLPQWVIDKLETRPKVAKDVLAEPIPEGQRNTTLTSIAGSLRKRGADEGAILAALRAVNQERCEPPLADDELTTIVKSVCRYPAAKTGSTRAFQWTPKVITAPDLLKKELPEPVWIIPDILTEGVSLLAGKPKSGKSWMALEIAIAVACGGYAFGKIRVEPREVLYLALEDSERRLQDRLKILLRGTPVPEGLHLVTEWLRLDDGGRETLEKWLSEHPNVKLIVIDVLKRIRPREKPNRNLYDVDYEAIALLKNLADSHKVSMLILHHTSKRDAEDFTDSPSGSTGLSGAADAVWVLKRSRGQADAELLITGRDIEEKEIALTFDLQTGGWTILGDAEEYRMSKERREILKTLREAGEVLTPKAIADQLGRKETNIRFLLNKLVQEGQVIRVGYGKYTVTPTTTLDRVGNSTNGANGAINANTANGANGPEVLAPLAGGANTF
ncbi:MAG TPA: AAA family ATPase [Firmicutes bacterium]|nr:AAA family ATPase [Bacillota bacterium]